MTEAVAVLAIAGWAAAGFFSGFLFGRERSRRAGEKAKKGHPKPGDAVLDTQADKARREWKNFLDYDGTPQEPVV